MNPKLPLRLLNGDLAAPDTLQHGCVFLHDALCVPDGNHRWLLLDRQLSPWHCLHYQGQAILPDPSSAAPSLLSPAAVTGPEQPLPVGWRPGHAGCAWPLSIAPGRHRSEK